MAALSKPIDIEEIDQGMKRSMAAVNVGICVSVHTYICTPLFMPQCVPLIVCLWLCASDCVPLAVFLWLCASAVCLWLCASGCLLLVGCSSLCHTFCTYTYVLRGSHLCVQRVVPLCIYISHTVIFLGPMHGNSYIQHLLFL